MCAFSPQKKTYQKADILQYSTYLEDPGKHSQRGLIIHGLSSRPLLKSREALLQLHEVQQHHQPEPQKTMGIT